MKLCVVFVVLLVCTTYAKSSGQEQTVTLKLNQASFYELFDAIRKQTGLRFLYSADQMSKMPVVNVDANNKKVCDLLTDVLAGTPLTFVYDKEVVMLVKRTDAAAQQQKTVRVLGKVTDEKKQPLPGVTIMVKGLTVGTATDKDGKYRLTIPNVEKFTLLYSFIGMQPVEVKYAGKDTINVVMKEEVASLDEVQIVSTGYQNVNRRDMVGAYTTVKQEDILMPAYTSIDQMLQGQVAGMIVMNSTGRVGASPTIQIRGASTLLGTQAPLWVVDGIIQPDPLKLTGSAQFTQGLEEIIGNQISWLNPNDIETITVLKDASAAAIYGSRASNGVIVVTTKRGKADRLTVTYSGTFSVTDRPSYDQFNLMNSQERVQFSEEAYKQGLPYAAIPRGDLYTYDGLQRLFFENKIDEQEFITRKQGLEAVNTDWFDLLTRRAFSHNHTLGVSGGSEKIRYNVSLGYNKADGQEIGNSDEGFTGRLALNTILRKNIKMDASISGSTSVTHGFNTGVDPLGYATSTSRSIPAFDENGKPVYYRLDNGYYYNEENETLGFNFMNEQRNAGSKVRGTSLTAALDFRWDITDWIAYQATGGYSQTTKNTESYRTEKTYYVANKYRGYDYGSEVSGSPYFKAALLPFGGEMYMVDATQTSYNIQNKILISKSFNSDNRLNVLLGMEVRSAQLRANYNTVWGYMPERGNKLIKPNEKVLPIGNSSVASLNVFDALYGLSPAWSKDNNVDNYFSWFGTLAYSFKERYVLNANVRNDASNRFGQNVNKRIDPTYSFGMSWKLGEESFMAPLQNVFGMLTLRATYGVQGNVLTNKSPELVLRQEGMAVGYNQFYSTISGIPNPFLKWERTKTWNFGLDMELLQIFNITAEYYIRSSNSIVSQDIAYEYGKTLMDVNGGKIRNKGLEFTVVFSPIRKKDMALSISLNSSKNWNDAAGKAMLNPSYSHFISGGNKTQIIRQGYPIDAMWSFAFAGLDPNDGRPLFHNLDVPAEERSADVDPLTFLVYEGSRNPDFTGGLNLNFRYKSFNLGGMFSLLLGGHKRLQSPYKNMSGYGKKLPSSELNLSKDLLKRWQKPGDELTTNIPGFVRVPENETKMTLPTGSTSYWMDMWANSDALVVDASFFRCQQLNLTYNMNRELCERMGFKTLSVSMIMNNVFVIASDRFDGFDPELADQKVKPKSYSLGINIGF